ncbi:MAG: histidine phosphatase family protein [Verrucomicrobia bacterium]|nr:histidine phosphatase family protein [Verrucomicrobiota bacterium]
MDPCTRLLLIRHAEVAVDYHRVFGGRIDMELSPHGHHQASRLAQYLKEHQIDHIYTSPMVRARQTLAAIEQFHLPEPVPLAGLREVDFGSWTGLSWEQVRERFNKSAYHWLTELDEEGIPEAERVPDFRARVEDCLDHILSESPQRTSAVVCHGGVIRMALAILLDLPLPKMAHFEIDYASVTSVEIHPHKREVRLLNLAPWRDVP